MADNHVGFRLANGLTKKALRAHARKVQRKRAPNVSRWLQEAVAEKLEREQLHG